MEKSAFDKKRMGDLYDELFSTLGQQNKSGQGMFHKKFIQVCSLLSPCFISFSKSVVQCRNMLCVCSFFNSGQNTVMEFCYHIIFPIFLPKVMPTFSIFVPTPPNYKVLGIKMRK